MKQQEINKIFSIGHSSHPVDKFIGMLKINKIEQLVDIRTIPKSRYNQQFSQDNLKQSLQNADIEYQYIKNLGGLRKAKKDSPNTGWHNSSFRGYADYMQTMEFENALEILIALGKEKRTAMMCAENNPRQCHRSLVADALTVRNIEVEHIMPDAKTQYHTLTDFAHVQGTKILYLSDTAYLPGLD